MRIEGAAFGALALVLCALPLAAAEGPRWGPGASLRFPQHDLKLELTGYVQGDLRTFPGWPENTEDQMFHAAGTDVRRLRLGLEAEWHGLGLDFSADPQDTGDHLKNAYVDIRLAAALRLRAGHFKLPTSRERLTPAARLDFVERSLLAQNLSPDRDWGAMVHGTPFKRAEYMIGVFAGDGSVDDSRAGTTLAGRIVYGPFKPLALAASLTRGTVESPVLPVSQLNIAKGFKGEGPSGFTYFQRPVVNGRRTRLGLDAMLSLGPAAFKAEALYAREQRLGQSALCPGASYGDADDQGEEVDPTQPLSCEDLSDVAGLGWSVSSTWLVTGEKKKARVSPAHPLPQGAGAVELGVRVEGLRFDDTANEDRYQSTAPRARDIRPAADLVITAGASWWPTYWSRLNANLIIERLSDELRLPDGRKHSYATLLVRFQVALP